MHTREQDPEHLHAFADEALDDAAPQPALALADEERLPWLESADDEDEDAGGFDTARLARFAAFGLALLALVLGGLWLAGRRSDAPVVAEGGVIKAPAEPYKAVPSDQGGKTFAGTGDVAPGVSEGKATVARLGDGVAPPPPPAPAASGSPAPDMSGVGVQVGAYTSHAAAEAGWTRLSGGSEVLKGVKHRIVEGSADIGTVYRLQAVAGDLAAANALCASLKAGGIPCQVKR